MTLLYTDLSNPSEIIGTVIGVNSAANIAENSYLYLLIETKGNQKFRINATGYMNLAPIYANNDDLNSNYDIDCLDIPKIEKGDRVKFFLPKESEASKNNTNGEMIEHSTCWKKT